MNHPIHFVSLGPGDPELITLKGLKTLQKADIIYCPATQGKHGIISRATDILKAIEVDESLIHPFTVVFIHLYNMYTINSRKQESR